MGSQLVARAVEEAYGMNIAECAVYQPVSLSSACLCLLILLPKELERAHLLSGDF